MPAASLPPLRQAIGSVIFGQDEVINQSLAAILAGGHMLLIGVPGLAKTRLVETLGITLGLETKRIQCTPDLMPSDILGTEVLEESAMGKRSFRFVPGPVFSQLLMADEINRASPRTQSALLQAMQEHNVTVAGHNYPLPAPFHVMATQNPLEQEGTYPLPEAQLDRFLLQIDIGYPDLDAERQMLLATTTARAVKLKAGHYCRRITRNAESRAPDAGQRNCAERYSGAGAQWPAGNQRDRAGQKICGVGPRTARQPGFEPCRPRAGLDRWPSGAVAR